MGIYQNFAVRPRASWIAACVVATFALGGCKGDKKTFASCSTSNIDLCPSSDGYANPYGTELELLSWTETLRKASLELTGKLPTAAQIAATEEFDKLGFEASVWEMTRTEEFEARIKEIYNDLFLTDKYLGRENAIDLLDEEVFPNLRWYEMFDDDDSEMRELTNDSIAREALELIAYVVRNDKPFTEILTADYTVANGYSAPSMIGYPDIPLRVDDKPNKYRKIKIPGVPHAGILTSPMFLNRFPTSDTNRNRHRSRMAHMFFLNEDVNQFGTRPVDANEVEGENPTLNNPDCTGCHTTVDPTAGCFMNWDEQGAYSGDGTWHQDMLVPGYYGVPLPEDRYDEALSWLGEQFASDPRFATATVNTIFAGITGQLPFAGAEPTIEPPVFDAGVQDAGTEMDAGMDASMDGGDADAGEDAGVAAAIVGKASAGTDRAIEIQHAMLQTMGVRFVASKYNLKVLVREIVLSPYFRAKSAASAPTELQDELAPFGTARFLTPEHLTRKIKATTGIRWQRRFNSEDYLLSDYLIFYGGIDSDLVTKRIHEPNGVMSSLAQRMAYEVACTAVPFDFSKSAEDRLLFPNIDVSDTLAADDAKIRAAIVHLHGRLLGETLQASDEEVTATMSLLQEVYNLGRAGIADESVDSALPDACRLTSDPTTGDNLPGFRQVREDDLYTIRSWMAVVTYLLSDYRFLYE